MKKLILVFLFFTSSLLAQLPGPPALSTDELFNKIGVLYAQMDNQARYITILRQALADLQKKYDDCVKDHKTCENKK